MEITHSLLERVLKQMLDKMKFQLCLNTFQTTDYDVQLKDSLPYNAIVIQGDVVIIRLKTELFVAIMTKSKHKVTPTEFRQLLESCLRSVPRMRVTLTRQPTADLMAWDYDKSKFIKMTKSEYEKFNPQHPYEKEIHYNTDFRTTAIHWKSGIVVREHNKTADGSLHSARRKILMILSDPEIYNRVDDKFLAVESHEDLIYDIIAMTKQLTPDEILTLIEKLKNE